LQKTPCAPEAKGGGLLRLLLLRRHAAPACSGVPILSREAVTALTAAAAFPDALSVEGDMQMSPEQ